MSHVDEGLLQAYLDGAFAPGEAQADEIEAHLASCADCRVRLEDARALRDRAIEVLRHTTPADVRVPPFETVRARKQNDSHAGAPARSATEKPAAARRLARSQVRLAWAASVVLAVGAGWMANELVRRDVPDFVVLQDAAAPFDADASDARAASAEAPRDADDADASLRRAEVGRGTPGTHPHPNPPSPGEGADVVAGRETRPTDRDAESAAVRPDVPPLAGEAARAGDSAALDARAAADQPERALRARDGAAQLAQVDSPPPPAAVAVAPARPSNEPKPIVEGAEKLTDRDVQRRNDELRPGGSVRVQLEQIVVHTADTLRADTADTIYLRGRRAHANATTQRAAPNPAAPQADAAGAGVTRTAFQPGDVIELGTMPRPLADGRAFTEHVALLNDYTAAASGSLWSRTTIEQATAALGREPAAVEGWPPATIETVAVDGRLLVRQRYALEGRASLEIIQRPVAPARPLAEALVLRDRADALPPAGVPFKDLGESSPALRGESIVAVSRPGLVLLLKGSLPRSSLHAIAARIE